MRLPSPSLRLSDFVQAQVSAAATALAQARRPLLLGGRGAWLAGAGTALGRIADCCGALTATTALGRGLFPRSEFDLGVTGGFGAEPAMELINSADVVLVTGAALNQFTMRFGQLFGPGTEVVQVDVAPAATHAHVGRFISGDAQVVSQAIAEELERLAAAPSGWRESVDVIAARQQPAGAESAPDGRLDPRSAAAKIGALLPEDRVVVSDGGHFIAWANMYWPISAPDRMVMVGTAYQSIGLGFGSVPGAAMARPDSLVVLTSGDGGGLMALADLETAVRVAAGNGLAVIWNDAAYGAEVNLYGLQGLAPAPMLIPEVDFAALAAAVGAESLVVDRLDDLERLADWLAKPAAERRFLLLDLRVSSTVIAPYQREVIAVNARPA